MIRVNNILERSAVNGVGLRTVIWTQGCNLRCKGCFNPNLWTFKGGYDLDVQTLISILPEEIEGITISGGEPFLQANIIEFIREFKRIRPDLSVICFSGFSYAELIAKGFDLTGIDVLIAGRFEQENKIANNLRGSSNKEYHFISERYNISDLDMPKFEVIISSEGILFTGMMDSRLMDLSM